MNRFREGKIGDLLTLQRGFDITKKEQTDGTIPVISSGGIASYHNASMAKGPGVVIGRKGTLGTAFYVKSDYWPHDTTLWVKDFKGNNPEFIYYFLKALPLEKLDSGSANPTLNRNVVHQLKAPLPTLQEQHKIAGVLTALDAKIELNHRINEELEGMAKLLYDYWFVQFDFPMTAAQAAAIGKPKLAGQPYRASGGKMIPNEALKREIPEGWTSGNLEKLGRIIGGSTPSTEMPEYFSTDGTPWITPKDLSDNVGNRFIDHGAMGVTSEGIKAASLKLLPAGTVLMSSRAPIGYLAVARNTVTTNQGFKSFVPGTEFSTDYIYFTLSHFMKLIKANASGSTFKEISGGTLKVVQIHLPPVELVKKFTEFASSLSEQQSVLEKQNQELTQLRDWLLPMLMNGQVTVS